MDGLKSNFSHARYETDAPLLDTFWKLYLEFCSCNRSWLLCPCSAVIQVRKYAFDIKKSRRTDFKTVVEWNVIFATVSRRLLEIASDMLILIFLNAYEPNIYIQVIVAESKKFYCRGRVYCVFYKELVSSSDGLAFLLSLDAATAPGNAHIPHLV